MARSEFRETKRHCIECNKLYTPYQERQRFCSGAHRVKYFWKQQRAKVVAIEDKDNRLMEKFDVLQKENDKLKERLAKYENGALPAIAPIKVAPTKAAPKKRQPKPTVKEKPAEEQ